MRYHSWLSAACSLVLSLSACQQEAVAPEQQISGRYALDNNGTTDTYLDFNTGRLTIYKSDEAYPLAEHKIWDCNEDFFKADEASNYSITDGVLVSSWENFGKVELSEDKLLMQGKTYLELKGFESRPYSVIRSSKDRLDLTYAAETVELAINVENALPAWSLAAETKTEWISDLKVESNVLRFKTSSTATDRSGVIELKYPHAETVSLPVSQKPSTFIKPASESLTFGYEASSQTLDYTIENPIAGSSLNATTVALWISNIQISDTQISFKLSENNSGADRSSSFSLSYGGAPNVIVPVTQKWSASSFTLTPTSQETAYTGGTFSFDFAVNNPRADVNVVAASQANWITDVAVSGNKVIFKVTENNSGALRTGKIKLTYGSYATAEFNVTQKGTPVTSLSLNKSSLALHPGNSEKLVATVEPSDATLTWSSSDTSVATASSDGTVTATGNGTATITVSATDGSGKNAKCAVTVSIRHPEAIDMGTVVNGKNIKWASFNVGASSPEEYGLYYAWGETEPKENYSWSTYKFGTSLSGPFSKYNTNSSYGTVDNKTVLESSDDVASVKLGGKWRMPTVAEWTELRTKCTWTWTTNYNGTGVKGRIVTATNGNSIFLPAAGGRSDTNLYNAGSYGVYWSSSLRTGSPDDAWHVNFISDLVDRSDSYRCSGHSVRPVSE